MLGIGFFVHEPCSRLALAYPQARTIHLVMDNLNIHRQKALADVFGAEMTAQVWDRFTVHYTPTHGSWLNQAEIEIGLFSRQCLGKTAHPQSEDPKSRGQSLEPPHESGPYQNRLEIRPPSRSPQVRLQMPIFHAVKDLAPRRNAG